MEAVATIAIPGNCHNSCQPRLAGRLIRIAALMLVCACPAAVGCSGLKSGARVVGEVPAWQLAGAQPSTIRPLGRCRVDAERQVPANLVTPLCEEFSLVLVSHATDWLLLCSRCQLTGTPPSLDFENGAVVGLIANVGESASQDWPIHLQTARVFDGEGLLEFSFSGGIYHPVRTAGYFELAYVAGLRSVQRVRVGRRDFILSPRGIEDQLDSKWSSE
ncbi:MAG TPA: hypothetical protein PLL20_20450 [Phycisphaerae bacterium]|nr:hypothetical protein [Phycisphaerae bacterium]HRR86727.1 hypothetical protein [Phycisphaerae bacterium]